MGSLGMVQLFINVSLGLGLTFLWIRLSRPQKDDPRMSRGLQMLQSKISILEDLSDRTDHQVKQLNLLLDEKAKHVQMQIEAAQQQIHALQVSMKKSHEVAKIFQDKIPHEEIIERQNTLKYIKAAQMSHQGASLEEIQSKVDIPRSELEFLFKINRQKLMFDQNELPDWAPDSASQALSEENSEMGVEERLAQVGSQFRQAAITQPVLEEVIPHDLALPQDLPELPPIPVTQNSPVLTTTTAPSISYPQVETYDGKKLSSNILTGSNAAKAKSYSFPRVEVK